jgi:hypothetical protein
MTVTLTSTLPSSPDISLGKLKLNGHTNGNGNGNGNASTSTKLSLSNGHSNGHGESSHKASNGHSKQESEPVLVDPYNYVVSSSITLLIAFTFTDVTRPGRDFRFRTWWRLSSQWSSSRVFPDLCDDSAHVGIAYNPVRERSDPALPMFDITDRGHFADPNHARLRAFAEARGGRVKDLGICVGAVVEGDVKLEDLGEAERDDL